MGNACCDVHGVDEAEAFLDAAFGHEIFHGAGDVHEAPAARDLKPELFGETFHAADMPYAGPVWQIRTGFI